MKIYDISQEVFGCEVFPGDPAPERVRLQQISEGAVCNLTALSMCAHNGTHVDAPYHFIENGKTIDQVALSRFVGYAFVTLHEGEISAADAEAMVNTARAQSALLPVPDCDGYRRILVRGAATVTEAAASVFADQQLWLFGNESQTVGSADSSVAVHRIMLGSGMVLLEGVRLRDVQDGLYFLNAAPINLGQADGAPCRAWLIGTDC